MKAPKKIQIGPYNFEVSIDRAAMNDAKVESENIDAIGLCFPSQQILFVDPELAPDITKETLLHEVLHGIFYTASLGNAFSQDQEEQIVSGFSVTLLDTLRRNPELVRYLLDDNKTS